MKCILTLILSLAFSLACTSAESKKSEADLIYNKAVSDNIKDASKSYAVYQKALEAAKVKVLKSLEATKADLNDAKKGNLSIQDRAAAISEIDKRIQEVNEGALGDAIIAQNKPQDPPSPSNNNQISGKWKFSINGQPLLDIAFDGKKAISSNTQSLNFTIKKGTLEIVWIGGGTWTLKYDFASQTYIGKDNGGSNVTAQSID